MESCKTYACTPSKSQSWGERRIEKAEALGPKAVDATVSIAFLDVHLAQIPTRCRRNSSAER